MRGPRRAVADRARLPIAALDLAALGQLTFRAPDEDRWPALRLARGMTYKNAVAGLPIGGGKSVIIGNPKTDKTPALFEALGEALEVRVHAVDLPEPAASVAERLVREGLSNIVRHAGASSAVVTVDKLGATATIDVFDNGRGISGPEGYGLKGLRARVEEVGGEMTVEGNVLAATLPLEGK